MMRMRTVGVAAALSLVIGLTSVRGDDPSPSDRLAEAIKLFDAGQYAKSDAVLKTLKEEDFTDESKQIQLQRYSSLATKAIAAIAEAQADFSAGESALKEHQLDEATKRFQQVSGNQYAPAELKTRANTKLSEIEKLQASRESAKPASAPIAPPPTASASPSAASSQGKGPSIVEELALEHELLWQQAEKAYRDAESKLRKAVLAEDFDEARRLLALAKQTIELNRRYASPASKYEDYRNQAGELEKYVDDEERSYDERVVHEKQLEVQRTEEERANRVQLTKNRRVEQLMDQASELRKERRYDDAIQVLDQVLTIDPDNEQAAWMKDTLGDLAVNIRDRQAAHDMNSESQDVLVDATESGIPWHKDINYPKNWPEITAKRTGAEEAAEPEINRQVRKKLSTVAPELKFDAQPFEEVIEKLRQFTGLNIIPNWTALESASIDKTTEVTLKLQNVTFEKAMKLILDELGGGETELAYEIADGVIQISTKEDLSRNPVARVYNVQDLIITVPTFRGRTISLDQIGQGQNQQGGLGGGRFLRGGGGGGGGGGAGGNLFGGSGGNQNDDDDLGQNQEDPLQPIIQLIQQTIDPESWREAGGNVGTIQALNQQIIITQTTSAHAQIRDLLKQLRQSRALQVAVEARYITITRNWLEQIGVDLDVVLNNGNAGFDRTTILDPATNNPVLVPRQFSRLGFTPGAPGGVGIGLPTQPFGQPYGQPGLVPAVGNVGPASGTMTPVPIVNNTLDLAAPQSSNIAGSLGALGSTTPAFQMFGSFLDNIQVDFLLRATQIDRRTSDLDAPRLVLFNGQRATFEAFVEQDYIAALIPIIGDNAGAFQPQVGTALTGRSLDVQATVSADRRYVTMTVRTFTRILGDFRTVFFQGSQTVGSGFIELATQTTQQIRTTVSVPDGGTLLIGGLKLSAERDIDAGVPILSRIPVLKRAFSNTSNVKDDQVLLILIKPSIIIQEEAEAEAFPTLSSASGR